MALKKKSQEKKGLLWITLALQLAVTNIYHDNICLSNAQYYEPGAQHNLWCEILEFWAYSDSMLTYSWLCCWEEKCAMNDGAKQASLGAIVPLLHSNRASFIMQ